MDSGPTSTCEVVVCDVGVDAALIEVGGESVLVLRPAMSFGAAVQAVLGVAPGLPADDAAKIVRRALPHAVDLGELLAFPVAACACQSAPVPRRGWRALIGL